MAPELTPEDQSRLADVQRWFSAAEAEHREYEKAWDHQDALYFGHKRFREAYATASPRDKDAIIGDGRKLFGEELHIPYTFSTIETIMPRTLSNRPRMLWLPRDKTAEQNVENVRIVCDAQQQRADYELKLQTTVRSGLKHGLGVQKVYWRLDQRDSFVLREDPTGQWVRSPTKRTAWDDPDVDDVDIRDFYWDPFADSMRTLRKALHRTWRDTAYCVGKIESGAWGRYPLTADDLTGSTGKEKHAEAWRGRRTAQGLPALDQRNDDIHEVWEFHDGSEIVTVLDRKWIVSIAQSPYWHGEFPFHIYRPIEVEHRFVGQGVIDPIEDLQLELNWLRTDRRWNAMLKLHQTYAYNDGVVDPAQIKVGPGNLVPVNGDPRDLLVPLTVGDIPNSGYQEEVNLQSDIERTTGVDDTVAGTGGQVAQTATGVQLVQAAAGLRIQAYTRRVELELIKPEARQWLALDQQRWTENRDVRVPYLPKPGEPQRFWAIQPVGPAELAGEFDVEPEGGATAPDNVPQQRQDGQVGMQLFGNNPNVDQHKLTLWAMDKFGIAAPETFVAPPTTVPPQTLDLLKEALVEQAGMDPVGAQGLIESSLHQALDAQQQQDQSAQQSQQPQPPQLSHAA